MKEPQHIASVLLCDTEWSELELRENLEQYLLKALRGERPTQDGFPECDFYIEVSVYLWPKDIIVYLFFCDMAQRGVRVPLKRHYKIDRSADEIARDCIDQLWARFPV